MIFFSLFTSCPPFRRHARRRTATCRALTRIACVCIALGIAGIVSSVVIVLREPPSQFPWNTAGGRGTDASPYRVENCTHLAHLSDAPSAAYVLTRDIDCAPLSGTPRGFTPIGIYDEGFTGSLRGDGHVIRNVTIALPSNYVGLFGKLGTGARLSDFIAEVYISGYDYVGGIAGWAGSGSIRGVTVRGNVAGRSFVGGVAGLNRGTLKAVTSEATVNGTHWVGGIVGLHDEGGSAGGVTFSGSVAGNGQVGGIAGVSRGAYIGSCAVRGSVRGRQDAGTIAGWVMGGAQTPARIENCRVLSPSSLPVIGRRGMP